MGCTVSTKYKKKINENVIHDVEEIKVDPSLFVTENKRKFSEVYRIAQSLGSGTYGEVKTCFHRETGAKRAVKLFRKDLLHSEIEKDQLFKEISVLKSLDHPNIIRTFEFFEDSKRLYLVMEYCSGGELFNEILKRQSFTETDAAKIFTQILQAVCYLHSHGIIHGDLNPENILLEDKNQTLNIKIADFGSAVIKSEKLSEKPKIGKAYYVAPEVYEGLVIEKSDLWSCGVILYILLCGHPPFDGENEEQIIGMVKRGRFDLDIVLWNKISPEARDLIERLICHHSKRLTSAEALKHNWMGLYLNPCIRPEEIVEAITNLSNFRSVNKISDAIITFVTSQFVSSKETKRIREIFLYFDTDGDGKISKNELLVQIKKCFGDNNAEEIANNILKQVDSDNSGFIDYTEFVKANIYSDNLVNDKHLKIAFAIFDSDSSGKISADEIKKLFEGQATSDESIWTNFVKTIDKNGDGEIDLEEFKALVFTDLKNA